MRIFIKTIFILLFLQAGISSASERIPFEVNPKIHNYLKKSIEAFNSRAPKFLRVVRGNDNEKEEIFQYLRRGVQKPIPIWELILLDYPQLRLLRNEIFARHGYVFDAVDLSNYFKSFKWYKPNPNFSESELSQIERENISLIKRLEYLKFRKNLASVNKPNLVAPRNVIAENEFAKITDSQLIFKATGKQIALKRQYYRHDGHDELVYFSTVSMFDNVPVIFVRDWQHEFLVTGQSFGKRIVMYDIGGNLIAKIGGGTTLHFIKEMDAFITVSDEGCCGTHYGQSFVFDRKGKIKFSSSYGDERLGVGSIEYYMPLWSSNSVAFVCGEISQNRPGPPSELYNHLVVLDSAGGPQIDLRLAPEDSLHGELKELVLLSPDVLYERSEVDEAIIFLKQALPFNPKIDKLFRWKPHEYSEEDFGTECSETARKISISPILNPSPLWEKAVISSFTPIVTIDTIFFTVREPEKNNSTTLAVDKFTGKDKWEYKMNGLVESISHAQNYLAVQCSSKIALIEKNSGKLIWETQKNVAETYRAKLALTTKSFVESYSFCYYATSKYHHIVNLHDLSDGKQIKSLNITDLIPMEKSNFYRFIVANGCLNVGSNLICYNIVEDGKGLQSSSRLLVVSINDYGNILWSREIPLQRKTANLQVKDCLIYITDVGSIAVLDPSSGKTLHLLKDGDIDFKIDPDTTSVVRKKIIWERMHLESTLRKHKNYFITQENNIRRIIDPTCLVKNYLDGYVYLEDFDPSTRSISLALACQGKPLVGEAVWHLAPSKNRSAWTYKILNVDHYYILVSTRDHCWAIGEEALSDYQKRMDGIRKNEN